MNHTLLEVQLKQKDSKSTISIEVKYAKKLGFLLGEKWKARQSMIGL